VEELADDRSWKLPIGREEGYELTARSGEAGSVHLPKSKVCLVVHYPNGLRSLLKLIGEFTGCIIAAVINNQDFVREGST
jgi:hypothetical protein